MIVRATMRQQTAEPSRLRLIAALAEALAKEYCGVGPVDPVRIIDALPDLTWSQGSYGASFDGLIEYDGLDFHIYINGDRCCRFDIGRGVFTLCHELGHYYIDEHRLWLKAHPNRSHCSILFRPAHQERPHEREADIFASNLMLPATAFRQRVHAPAPGAEAIIEAAAHFRTSLTSTAIRFCELEPFPCAIIRWTEAGVCQWVRASPRVQSWFPAIARVLTGPRTTSATAQVLAEAGTQACVRTVTAPLTTWFPDMRPATRDGGPALTEQAIPLGRHGVLTVLSSPAWGGLTHFEGDAMTTS